MQTAESLLCRQSYRDDVLEFAAGRYRTEPEYLWKSSPADAVLRRKDNRKWYAVIMNVAREKLGLFGEGNVDILNVKCDPDLGGALRMEQGFLPAYHMNHEHWLTVLLDGTADREKIFSLLEMSFDLTAGLRKSNLTDKRGRNGGAPC